MEFISVLFKIVSIIIIFSQNIHCIGDQYSRDNQNQRRLITSRNINHRQNSNQVQKGSTNIDLLRKRYITLESALWGVIGDYSNQNDVIQQIHDAHIQFFREAFGEVGVEINVFDPIEVVLHNSMNHIALTVRLVQEKYLKTSRNDFNEKISVDFARHGINLTHQLDSLFNVINDQHFFESLKDRAEKRQCDDKDTIMVAPSQLLYEYYTDLTAAELKAYAVIQLSYMFLTIYKSENLVTQANDLRKSFNDRSAIKQGIVRQLLSNSNRQAWQCDPPDYHGTTLQVTRFMDGYIDNELNLNEDENCQSSCSDYTVSRNVHCNPDTYCGKDTTRRCNGTVVNCSFLESSMTICPSDTTARRYDHIVLESGQFLGRNGYCKNMEKVESWTRWFVQCSNCFCFCDEINSNSDRYFSLRNVVSNIHDNMIVTGISIAKKNQIFHLQINERKLGSRGQVTEEDSDLPWSRSNDNFKLTDINVKDSIDYFTLKWDNRSIDLGSAIVPSGYVVTGVRFQINKRSHLELQVRGNRFNFETGAIYPESVQWFSPSDSGEYREEIILKRPDIPIRTIRKSVPDPRTNTYIIFGPSDIYADAGQTTVPFIDSQILSPPHPIPLSGVGLYYKGQTGFGGFIAPKLIMYDFSDHIY